MRLNVMLESDDDYELAFIQMRKERDLLRDDNEILRAENEALRASIAEAGAHAVDNLKFPTFIREMWSGREVRDWLKEEARLLLEAAKDSK